MNTSFYNYFSGYINFTFRSNSLIFNVIHPEVLYKYNLSVNNTTLYFIYNKNSILSGRHVSTFIRSSSGTLGKEIQELSIFQCIVGSKMVTYLLRECEIHNFVCIGICVAVSVLKG